MGSKRAFMKSFCGNGMMSVSYHRIHMMPSVGHGYKPYRVQDGLAVYRLGHGFPVLLMPGPHRFQLPGDGSARELIDGLLKLGCQVISFDPPASGHSFRAAHLGMAEMHQCADEALAMCGLFGPVAAMGHSMGGLVLLAYALDKPERLKRLVLVGTGAGGAAYMQAPGALWNRSHPAFWRMALLGILHIAWPLRGPEQHLNNFISRHSFFDPSQHRPASVRLRDWLRPRKGRTDWHRIASKLDYVSRLNEISIPTLVLCGRHDPQFPPACSEELARGILQAQVRFFERSGHYPFIEEGNMFWCTVGNFLESHHG